MAILADLFGMPQSPAPAPAGGGWTSGEAWQALSDVEKAAAMALMEADSKGGRVDVDSARNALGAMINRADRTGVPLGEHVSGKIYQPTIEASQGARLSRIVNSPEFSQVKQMAEDRLAGRTGDWVKGATHFLAPEQTMLALEAREPSKYKNWGPRGANWTGFDPTTGAYRGVVMRDGSHAFLAPEGAHSATFEPKGPAPYREDDWLDPGVPQQRTMVAAAAPASYPGSIGPVAPAQAQQEEPRPQERQLPSRPMADAADEISPASMVAPPPLGRADLTKILAVLQRRKPLGTMGA